MKFCMQMAWLCLVKVWRILERERSFKGLTVNPKESKVMVNDSKGEVLESKVNQCVKCSKGVMAKSVVCTK